MMNETVYEWSIKAYYPVDLFYNRCFDLSQQENRAAINNINDGSLPFKWFKFPSKLHSETARITTGL